SWRGWCISVSSQPRISTASTVKNQRCQPPCSARKLKAAPVLNTSTRSKKPVTGIIWPSCSLAITICLVNWSSRATTTARISQGSISEKALRESGVGLGIVIVASGMGAGFAFAEQVAHAAPAQRPVFGVATDRLDVVPAALALLRRARRGGDAIVVRAADLGERRGRGHGDEAQVLAHAGHRGKLVGGEFEFEFGLQ